MKEAYERGMAVGQAMISSDCIVFRFKDELFEFPTFDVVPKIAKFNGSYYEAKVSRLRKMKASNGRR